jgi:hypothetical protein
MDGGGKGKMSDQWTRQALQALKGHSVVYTSYPLIAAGAAAGTTLVNAGAANTFGANTEIVPATIATEFWFCQVCVCACSLAENYVVDINRSAALVIVDSIFQFRCSLTLVTPNLAPFSPMYPVRIAPLTQVTGRCASVSGADTVDVSVLIATGL